MAGDLLHWQNNSLTYLYGQTTRSTPTPSRPSPSSTPAAGLGRHVLSSTTSGSTASAAATATPTTANSARAYRWARSAAATCRSARSRIVLIGATYERGESSADGVPNQNYLLGPAVDSELPGFDRFALNFYYRKPDGSTGRASGQWQVTPTGP